MLKSTVIYLFLSYGYAVALPSESAIFEHGLAPLETECSQALTAPLHFEVHHGERPFGWTSDVNAEGIRATILGDGQSGVTYRVRNPDGTQSAFKEFFTGHMLDLDAKGLIDVRELIGDNPDIQVIKFKKIGDTTLQVENIEGQTLETVLHEQLLPTAQLERLRRVWLDLAKRAGELRKNNRLIVKSNGIIVDARSLKMYVIDAY